MIDRLVANGWVERRTARDDRRVKRVYLTRGCRAGAQAHLARGRRDGRCRARRSLGARKPAVDGLAVSASRRRWCRRTAPSGRLRTAASARRTATAGTTAGPRHEQADAATGADRRARARGRRRAGLLAAGRPPHLDRERLRQGRHRPDRQRSSRPHHRGAASTIIRRSPPATCCCGSIPPTYQLALGKGRRRSRFRACRRRADSRRTCAKSGPRRRRPRTSWNICEPRRGVSASCPAAVWHR